MKKDKQAKKMSLKEKLLKVKKIATSEQAKELAKSLKDLRDSMDVMK